MSSILYFEHKYRKNGKSIKKATHRLSLRAAYNNIKAKGSLAALEYFVKTVRKHNIDLSYLKL